MDAEVVGDAISIRKELNAIHLYQLLHETIRGDVATELLEQKLTEFAPDNNHGHNKQFQDMLADVVVQCELEATYNANQDFRGNLTNIIKFLLKANILSNKTALERFEFDLLVQVGLYNDKKQLMTAYNRLRTRLYFKQKKYNLLREENEGFSKIITSLNELKGGNQEQVLETITRIIGKYRVDPNRVLDLILDVFEFKSDYDYDVYIDFIRAFYTNTHKIVQLIRLKLTYYSNNKDPQILTPQSFYRLIAILIHKGIMEIDDIYNYLLPADAKILDYHKSLVEEARLYSKKYNMVIVGEEKAPPRSFREDFSDEDLHLLEVDNQKVNICLHLMDLGDWEQVLEITRKLPEFYCFSNHRIATSACDYINYLIDPIYRECGLPKSLSHRIRKLHVREIGPKQVTQVEDLRQRIFPMLISLGPFLSVDTLLLTKIIRILKHILFGPKQVNQEPQQPEDKLFYAVLDVINDSILPSISLSGKNCCLARELWSLLKNFNYHIRYKLYSNWREESSNAALLTHRGETFLCAKYNMKRLSKESFRFIARHIGKLCYSNPVLTLNYILLQIQSYDNLIGLVVDALRFLPPIAIDALIYCIIEFLSDPYKNKKSVDGMALAPWLTSISTFSANIILRYKVEFTGFLEYISNQLKAGNSLDLQLLTDLIQKMTGIETIQAITDDKIEALMGGDILRTECAYFNQVKNTRKSSARLKDAIIESRLAMPLCTLMAQLRDSLFFNQQDGTPLKLIGKLYDQSQETLVQYGVFLSMNLSIDDYMNFMPPLDKLMVEHELDPDSAFFLARPMIFHKIKSKFLELRLQASKELPAEEGETPELSKEVLNQKYIEAARSVIDPIADTVKQYLLEKYNATNLSSKLFVIFWILSMGEIDVPVNCYEREIQKVKNTLSEFGKIPEEDLKKRKERDRCNHLLQNLKQELATQLEQAAYIRAYIESEKDNLFCDKSVSDDVYLESRQFVQHCAFSRSILTANDAIYSARFFFFLHELEVKDYSTIICLDRLLCDLTYMMGACTENEANHYGRFLCNILKTISQWHADGELYNQQCEDKPGSIIRRDQSEHITYEKFRDICFKWHYRLTRSFSVSLESNNYIQIRNSLIVMIKIIDYYPAIKHFGKGIGLKIEEVRKNEKEGRPDLYALATAYAGKLDDKKPYLMHESSFHKADVVQSSKSSSNSHRERHSSSSSRKRARHS